jgi:Fic family protein
LSLKNSKSFAGQFRRKGEEVVVMNQSGKVVHEGAPQTRITYLLNELVSWYEKNKSRYPAFILAAVIHNQFENIHPFADGNGRVGRILLNNILIKHNLPPLNINLKIEQNIMNPCRIRKKSEYQANNDLYIKEYKH